MNSLRQAFIYIFFCSVMLAQQPVNKENPVKIIQPEGALSNILVSTTADSVLVKVELKNAQYDIKQGNSPFFVISNPTSYQRSSTPALIIKKTALVTEKHLAAIKKSFGKYITADFQVIPVPSLSRDENLNTHRIYPFRVNSQNQIEELIEYDLNWKTLTDNQRQVPSAASFSANSVLASGTWYKIALTENGIYKLDKTFFSSLGIDVNNLDPRKIRIYGNGGKALPEQNGAFRYDDLTENSIKVIGESDGVFDNTDYALFYGSGVKAWRKTKTYGHKFNRIKNYYSDSAFYYINVNLGNGKRMVSQQSSPAPSTTSTSTYDYYNFHESDKVNFIKSGRLFVGEYFEITNSYGFNFNDGNFVTGDSIFSTVSVAGRGVTPTVFSVTGNGLNGSVTTNGVNIYFYLDPYADVQASTIRGVNNTSTDIAIAVSKQTAANVGWLDYVTVNARRNLVVTNNQFQFRDSRVEGLGNICDYSISNPTNTTVTLWNISDPLNPLEQTYNSAAGSINFKAPSDSVIEYAIAPGSDFFTPVFVSKVNNQNLHAVQQADYVIVTHPIFMPYAQRMANLHQQQEGLTYVIATTDQIYNEFGSGKPEASAIRDFVRMLYTRNSTNGKQPKYLLLMGDGSYDNINRNLISNTNLIPTYQTEGSVSVLQSTATDDFYGLMDPTEGIQAETIGAVDIGVGRFICRSTHEMEGVVHKTENYYRKNAGFQIYDDHITNCTSATETPMGDWRNWVLFMGDDEDQATHMSQADNLANIIQSGYPLFNIDKIYLDAYQRYSTPGGSRFPDAAEDMNRRIKKGALLFNYTGHGGEVGLTGERVLDIETINKWDNFNKLPLFITATCEFSRYDDPGRTSAGELCLLNPVGGMVSLLTTCRLAFSSTNFVLNQSILNFMFKKMPDGKKPALGDVIRQAKSNIGQLIYYANFHLLGDPALTLAYPEQKIITTKINTTTLTPSSSDTLSALSKITITGFVADTMGNKLTNFNGVVYPTVFDKVQDISGLLNSPDSYSGAPGIPFKFKLQNNILYKGKTEVKNGDFIFTFIVPKDISFAYGPGKISYYATNGLQDAGGFYRKVVVGGGAKNSVPDYEGPQVNLFLNDKNFVNGGTTNEKPVLYANLVDSSGINTLGTGIGHDISVVLDKNTTKPIVLNDYYEAALNSYQAGRVRYPFDELSEGNHQLTFKVWDIQNNSNLVTTDFVVAHSAELALNHVLNYPNPFSSTTKFFFEHNQPCNPLKVSVQIFTISGKVVKTLQKSVTCEGFRPEGIDWDGKDDFGDKLARGVYIYKVSILNTENKKAEKTEKLVILN